MKYVYDEEETTTYLTYTIIGYDQDFYDGENIEILDFSGDNTPTIKFKVIVSMYNFKISTIIWDEECKEYTEDQVICELDEVRNHDIMFDSGLQKDSQMNYYHGRAKKVMNFHYLN